MSGKKIIMTISVMLLLSLIGAGVVVLMRVTSEPSSEVIIDKDVTADADGTVPKEEHWNAENQVHEIGEMAIPKSNLSEDGIPREGHIPIEEFEIPEPTASEPDPRQADVLKGKVSYDDIPNASLVEGDYDADDIKTEMIKYLNDKYTMTVISDIVLIGNGSAPSQDTGEETSYANYVVTMNDGKRIGISVTSSNSEVPYVTETNYLVINPSLLYKVEEDEYVQMDVTEEEHIPADTVIDH